jgi:hypothetical protein
VQDEKAASTGVIRLAMLSVGGTLQDRSSVMIYNRLPEGSWYFYDHKGTVFVFLYPSVGASIFFDVSKKFRSLWGGVAHSPPFACKVLTRKFDDAFGSSATTGGLHFYS